MADLAPSLITIPNRLSYWLNNQFGDCVTAGQAAAFIAFSVWGKTNATPPIWISDAAVGDWARAHGVLNGASLTDVMEWMQTDPLIGDSGVGYTDGPHTAVDYSSQQSLMSALSTGPVKLGVAADQLERVVGTTNGWVLTGAGRDQNEDHDIEAFGYGTLGEICQALGVEVPAGANANGFAIELFTWDTIGVADHQSLIDICGEAHIRTPTVVQMAPPAPGPAPGPLPPPPQPILATGQFISGIAPGWPRRIVTVKEGLITSIV